ncbi:MAG: hypothetical protein ACK41C_16150 [Phenylobacterium sp.]|uniref:hypothetical protein n=1 Tax=Phenylobacterium sp. TaxID=1871053 RepID=UPI00391AF882
MSRNTLHVALALTPALALGLALAGCSVDDLRARAETVRVQAEGIGTRIEEARSDQLLAESGGMGGVEAIRPPGEGEGEAGGEEKAAQAKAAPRPQSQPPVVVYLPAQ